MHAKGQHWADVVLSCMNARHTFAYGDQPIRAARDHLVRRLQHLEDTHRAGPHNTGGRSAEIARLQSQVARLDAALAGLLIGMSFPMSIEESLRRSRGRPPHPAPLPQRPIQRDLGLDR